MSEENATEWLLSQNKFQEKRFNKKKANVISVTSGKGGVGKTSLALKLSRSLSKMGHKVLLVDCDYNLSNTGVKLGIPLNDNLADIIEGKKSFQECLWKDQNFQATSMLKPVG